MTGRTHDLAAFTSLSLVVISMPPIQMTLATGIVALGANLLGGLAPDIDQPTAAFWHTFPAGSIVGRVITPMLGGHRFISHSALGIVLFGFLLSLFLNLIKGVLIVDMHVVWWAFMIGFVSHLIMDTFTKEGVFWLFPIPIRIGIPPIRLFRITTGGLIEKSFVFPGLILLNAYIYYHHYSFFLHFIKDYIK